MGAFCAHSIYLPLNFIRMPSNSKWYNWLLNPFKTLVDTINDEPSPSKWYENIPGLGDWLSQFDSSYQSSRLKSEIEKIADQSGMSLEEFFALNPDYKKAYDNPSDYVGLKGDVNTVKDGAQSILGIDLSELTPAIINKLLGVTDVQENAKNRKFQSQEAEIARNWEAEQVKAAREWDSIGAQMERAAAAGVNPISIAMQNGGINASATSSIPVSPGVPAGSAGLISNGPLDVASTVFQGIGTLAENRLKQSQADDIIIMREYNVAEKIANTDHLRNLCKGVDLSNVAQTIQNRWLDVMNQVTYDNMLLDKGVKRSEILENRSIAKLNIQQIASIKQSMENALKEFNAKLPLELQMMETQIDLNKQSAQELYYESCMRYLQLFEQENRNRQSSAEATGAEIETSVARETMEDAISQFHNAMVQAAAEAGISLYDYMYYGYSYSGAFDFLGKAQRRTGRNKKGYFANEKWNRSLIELPNLFEQPMR